MSAHNSEPYYRPHEDTRLAFDARGVHYLCLAPRRTVGNDPNLRLLFEREARATFARRFPGASKDVLDHMTLMSVGLEIAECTIAHNRHAWLRLAKGEADLQPPQPKRPETLLIAIRVQQARDRKPDEPDWSIWNRIAEFFNHGHPAVGRLAALDGWGVRSAVTAYGELKTNSDRIGGWIAKSRRRQRLGTIHEWDRNIYDFMCDAELLQNSSKRYALLTTADIAAMLLHETVYRPLAAFDQMYVEAIRDPRFKGFKGAKLADRIDELFGFEATVCKILNKQDFRNSGLEAASFISNSAA